jgi:hypothetical protein
MTFNLNNLICQTSKVLSGTFTNLSYFIQSNFKATHKITFFHKRSYHPQTTQQYAPPIIFTLEKYLLRKRIAADAK